jgi:hypothetical protein
MYVYVMYIKYNTTYNEITKKKYNNHKTKKHN